MSSIRVLSPILVNKIAAGEVIERPASVVKELVENAVDAGSSRIDVVIEGGGKRLIQVTDDGGGISAEDLALAFVPHATSKLADEDGLFDIHTMGFRGEALASIASISKAGIRTRRPDQTSGHEIAASGEDISDVRPAAAPAGTTVTVRELFFNTPARRKFLRADSTEFGHISEAVARIALAHPNVAFTLRHNDRAVSNLPATDSLRQRILDLYGPEVSDDLIEVPPRDGAVAIRGLIGTPAGARSTARWQYFFLNGRYIRDRNLGHALKEAYRGLVEPSRQPMAFLHLRLDPESVDVNVHPTKVEVRFHDGRAVHSHVLSALRNALNRSEIRPGAALEAELSPAAELPDDERRQGLREALSAFFKSQPAQQQRLHFPAERDRPANASAARSLELDPRPISAEPGQADASWQRVGPPGEADRFAPPAERTEPPGPREAEPAAPPARSTSGAIQVHDSYIIAPDAQGLVIIDQHALHERILYDQLKRRLAGGRLESQQLLLPATFRVTPDQKALAMENESLWAGLGIELAEFGPDALAVQRFPSFLHKLDPGAFLREALDALTESDETLTGETLLEAVLAMMACKAAIKAGDPLTPQEIDELLARRAEAEKPTACPHGRPTQIRLTLRDLEKQFKRT